MTFVYALDFADGYLVGTLITVAILIAARLIDSWRNRSSRPPGVTG